jgi:L-asparaginase
MYGLFILVQMDELPADTQRQMRIGECKLRESQLLGSPLPQVVVLSTGGTISSGSSSRLDMASYLDSGIRTRSADLLSICPEATQFAELTFRDVVATSSRDISPDTWLSIRTAIVEELASSDRVSGIVVTHGTATLEETAYFLHLTVDWDGPIVLVGAQRPPSAIGSDAPKNILSAVQVAGAQDPELMRTVVVMNSRIYCPREVIKDDGSAVDGFRVPEFGLLGYVNPDASLSIYQQTTRLRGRTSRFATTAFWNEAVQLPRVDIISSYAGADGASVDSAVAAGAKGIVLDALPPGIWPHDQQLALERAHNAGVCIVYVTRARSGRTMLRPSLREQGFVSGDNLTAQKARVLLMLALSTSHDRSTIQEIFDTH